MPVKLSIKTETKKRHNQTKIRKTIIQIIDCSLSDHDPRDPIWGAVSTT